MDHCRDGYIIISRGKHAEIRSQTENKYGKDNPALIVAQVQPVVRNQRSNVPKQASPKTFKYFPLQVFYLTRTAEE